MLVTICAKSVLLSLTLVFLINTPGALGYQIRSETFKTSDGVDLAMTVYLPEGIKAGEKLPVLFEMLPYRKDDFFKNRDFSLYTYFLDHKFALVKVDIRGTGSSAGELPDREYSKREINDAIEIIESLSKAKYSNGKVAMWGISWGAFNAINVAMRQPKGLFAILSAHGSDDLFYDDIHFIDGIFHIDEYALSINHDNGFLRSPDYEVTDEYFKNRFDKAPWFIDVLKNQKENDFWLDRSLKTDYSSIKIPTFIIGGLFDGYKDAAFRIAKFIKAPTYTLIGPWAHDWPDNAEPGPTVEWRELAVQFFNHHLRGVRNARFQSSNMDLFVRESHEAGKGITAIPGEFCQSEGLPDVKETVFFLGPELTLSTAPSVKSRTIFIPFVPDAGQELGYWWGELADEMRLFDKSSLVFDSLPLTKDLRILGFPIVNLKLSENPELGNLVIRLEELSPQKSSVFVTGAGENTALGSSPATDLETELHYTSYTFKRGSKIRLAISGGAFPMFWPKKGSGKIKLRLGGKGNESIEARLRLPTLTKPCIPSKLPKVKIPRKSLPDNQFFADTDRSWPSGGIQWEKAGSERSLQSKGSAIYRLPNVRIEAEESTKYGVNIESPERASFRGHYQYRVHKKDGSSPLIYQTQMNVYSDRKFFKIDFTRKLSQSGQNIREKHWREKIPRQGQ